MYFLKFKKFKQIKLLQKSNIRWKKKKRFYKNIASVNSFNNIWVLKKINPEGLVLCNDKNFLLFLNQNFFKNIFLPIFIKTNISYNHINSIFSNIFKKQSGSALKNLSTLNYNIGFSFNSYFQLFFIDNFFIKIIQPSKKIKYISIKQQLYITELNTYNKQLKKQTVRGIAKNPVDHPNGGRTKGKSPYKTPWGKIAKHSK